MLDVCQHDEVLVDYEHPFGTIAGVRVADLKASAPGETRTVMTLLNARCAACGAGLSEEQLRSRIQLGGDLHDARFKW
jgi:hypothetical protein